MIDIGGLSLRTVESTQVQTNQGNSTIILPSRNVEPPPSKPQVDADDGHKEMFGPSQGLVYANALAEPQFKNDHPVFPVGSIIVREKYYMKDLINPETVIAMVKRKKGFSKKTGDWEFFVFKGSDLSLQSRETKGSCADCHSQVKESDWVFREYLKTN